MLNKYSLFIAILFAFTLTSCYWMGINKNFKTPSKEGRYPKFTRLDSLKGHNSKARSCFDVNYYDLAVDFNLKEKSIKGKSDIYLKIVEPTQELQLDLYPQLLIDSISIDEKKFTHRREGTAIFIRFSEQLIPETSLKIGVYYHGKPLKAKRPPWEGGFVWKKDKDGKPWLGVACQSEGASLWFPCKDYLGDKADSIQFKAKVPANLVCVSNGQLVATDSNATYKTYIWKVNYPISTYNLTFYIGNYRHFSLKYEPDSTLPLNFYVLPYNYEKAKTHFLQSAKILSTYEQLFGKYPFYRDGYKLVESPYAGMEHQSAIAYGNGYKNTFYNTLDYIILHETAHEWWGNSLSCSDFSDIWLHEGFATYCEMLYLERNLGKDMYKSLAFANSLMIANKYPVIGPAEVRYWDYRKTEAYTKGALTLHTLRNTIANDEKFFQLLKTFYTNFAYKNATTRDFISLCNQITQSDYNWFFNQYLYSRVCPVLEYEMYPDYTNGRLMLAYRWQLANKDFALPVQIKTDNSYFEIIPSHTIQLLDLGNIKWLEINPEMSYIRAKERKGLHKKF